MRRIVKIQFLIFIVFLFFATYYVSFTYMIQPIISRQKLLETSQIGDFLLQFPDASINQTFINQTRSSSAVSDILEKCGKDVVEQDYILVEIEANGSVINAYFDPVTQEAVCIYMPSEGGTGESGGGDEEGVGGTGGEGSGETTVSCTSNADCDDANPYTSDSCSASGTCRNVLKTCSGIGGTVCGDGQSCSGTTVSSSDGSCCMGGCTSTGGEDGNGPAGGEECQADSDCATTNPTIQGSCYGTPKTCHYVHLAVCAEGDDTCPEGCTPENDPDCT